MLALRAIARSAPRTVSRIAASTPKTAFIRPSLQTSLRSQIQQTSLLRAFSTSFVRRDDASQELAAKLQQEIALETEDSNAPAESNENIQRFLEQNSHWELHDLDNNQEVLLTRQYEDESITVSFSIADFNTPMMDGQGEEMDESLMDEDEAAMEQSQSGGANTKGAINQGKTSGGNFKVAPQDSLAPADREELKSPEEEYMDGAEEEQPAFPANVNVLVQRKGKGALRINLVADAGIFNIQSVTHLPDNKTTTSLTPSELIRHELPTLYTGPPFPQLDEEVQSLLEQYLEVRGVNTHLALFVPEYIDVKEQKEYLGWLRRVGGFVE
ncbi:hypothetical protein LTR62_002603 [Meristemomyces frigidus]|uniref:Mitochondrial glyco protein n=1 Tax=Meristemomyces frigidus TaxID=1508187 RepID=A0AAN7YQ57_9PEZI|nr:hypothetical protein LTR62_002603 [Meristemomyces frigidus]